MSRSSAYLTILPPGARLSGPPAPCVGSAFNVIYFSPYLLIIRQFNKCGVSTLMFDHTSEAADPGSVRRTASRFPLLFFSPHISLFLLFFPLGAHIFIASFLNSHGLLHSLYKGCSPSIKVVWLNLHQTFTESSAGDKAAIKLCVFYLEIV